MIIRKTQQPSDYPSNNIHDAYTESASGVYNCNYINNLSVGGGSGTSNNVYSTEEAVVGTWINGLEEKPVYRRVITYTGALTKNIDTQVAHLGTGVDRILRIDHSFTNGGNTTIYYNYAVSTSIFAYFTFKYDRAGGNLWVTAWNEGWSAPNLVVVVEYTKTSD